MGDVTPIPLAEAIRALRAEIVKAQAQAEGESVRFGVGNVELEFQMVVSREGGGNAGINFGVVQLGGAGKLASEETHTLKLTLSPVETEDGRPIYVGDRIERPT